MRAIDARIISALGVDRGNTAILAVLPRVVQIARQDHRACYPQFKHQ